MKCEDWIMVPSCSLMWKGSVRVVRKVLLLLLIGMLIIVVLEGTVLGANRRKPLLFVILGGWWEGEGDARAQGKDCRKDEEETYTFFN